MDQKIGILEDIHLKAIEALPYAIIIANEKGEMIVFNSQAELMFGYSRVEVLGKKLEILIPEDFISRHIEHREKSILDPKIEEGVTSEGLHKTGRIFPMEVMISPMIVAEAGTHFMIVAKRVK